MSIYRSGANSSSTTQTIAAIGPFGAGKGTSNLNGRTVVIRNTPNVLTSAATTGISVSCDGTNYGIPVLAGGRAYALPTAVGNSFFVLDGDYDYIKWDSTSGTATVVTMEIVETY